MGPRVIVRRSSNLTQLMASAKDEWANILETYRKPMDTYRNRLETVIQKQRLIC